MAIAQLMNQPHLTNSSKKNEEENCSAKPFKEFVFSGAKQPMGLAKEFEQQEDLKPIPLTAQQANDWRNKYPQGSIWMPVMAQCFCGGIFCLFAYLFQIFYLGNGWWQSALYGVLVAVVPNALCAKGISSKFGANNLGASVFKFFVWEGVKVVSSVVMLLSAPHWLGEFLSWPALILGLVVAFKGFWVLVLCSHLARKI
jgi:ATP synthase protein I